MYIIIRRNKKLYIFIIKQNFVEQCSMYNQSKETNKMRNSIASTPKIGTESASQFMVHIGCVNLHLKCYGLLFFYYQHVFASFHSSYLYFTQFSTLISFVLSFDLSLCLSMFGTHAPKLANCPLPFCLTCTCNIILLFCLFHFFCYLSVPKKLYFHTPALASGRFGICLKHHLNAKSQVIVDSRRFKTPFCCVFLNFQLDTVFRTPFSLLTHHFDWLREQLGFFPLQVSNRFLTCEPS